MSQIEIPCSLATPDCPADNHARQLAQFLYETLATIISKIKSMYKIKRKATSIIRLFCLVVAMLMFSCKGKEAKEITKEFDENSNQNNTPLISNQNTVFKQTHSNLNGMVTEFVRKMYQDKKGNFWFGTNGDGIIRYDNKALEEFDITEDFNSNAGAVRV